MEETKDLDKQNKELELDDLLLSEVDGEQSKKSHQEKKIALLVAIGIVILATVVFIVYVLQEETSKSVAESPSFSSEIETERSAIQDTSPTSATDFAQLPIENTDSVDEFQRIIDQIKIQQKNQALPPPPSTQEPIKQLAKQPIKQPETREKEEVKKNQEKPKKLDEKSNKDLSKDTVTSGFYIQVGSFTKNSPGKEILNKIKSEKLSYRIQKTGNTSRLLVGPFKNKKEAQDNLSKVKERINKDAFIKEIK